MRGETTRNFFEDELDPEVLGIEIDPVEACALKEARDKNQTDFHTLKADFAGEEDAIESAIESGEIPFITYPSNSRNRVLCYQLVQLELKRLEHPDAKTYCNHSIQDHKKALRALIAKFPEQSPKKTN